MGRAIDSLWLVIRLSDNSDKPDRSSLSDIADTMISYRPNDVEVEIIGRMVVRKNYRTNAEIASVIGHALASTIIGLSGLQVKGPITRGG